MAATGDDETNKEAFSGIFATGIYQSVPPTKKEFYPWHLPRKQFVRSKQWGLQVGKLLEGRPPDEPLKYLGLPGADLLDLRYFHREYCLEDNRPLCFLGFNSGAAGGPTAIEMNLSLDEVRRLGNVDPRSHVRTDDFRGIARNNSIAWKSASELGPFDVVNLDFCDGFAADDPARDPSVYDAMQRLLGLQKLRSTPWLLLLTTRVGPSHFHAGSLALLMERFKSNATDCLAFEEACTEHFGTGDWRNPDMSALTPKQYFEVALTALCKWLLAVAHTSPVQIEICSSQAYTVDASADHLDLASVAFRCTPLLPPAADPAGLGTLGHAAGDECRDAAIVPGRVLKTIDVDRALHDDPALRQTMKDEQRQLLQLARYSPEDYDAWDGHEL